MTYELFVPIVHNSILDMLRVTVFNTAHKIVHNVVRQLPFAEFATPPTLLFTCYPRRYLQHCTRYCSRNYLGPDYDIAHVFIYVLSTALPATLHTVLFAILFWAGLRDWPRLCLRVAHNIAHGITNNIVRGVPLRYFYDGLLRFQNMTIPLYLHNFGNEFTFDAHAPRGYFAVFEQFALTA